MPRVGLNRTSPIHPQWVCRGLTWVAAGADHQLGITARGTRELCVVENDFGIRTVLERRLEKQEKEAGR